MEFVYAIYSVPLWKVRRYTSFYMCTKLLFIERFVRI